jgi:SAM-dependent methyltransferase
MRSAIDAPQATACPVCGTLIPRRTAARMRYDLPRCPACGLTFSHPMRAADAAFYEASTEYDEKWEFEFVSERLARQGRRGALLDLGCGDGRFLSRVTGRFAPTGLDFNPEAVRAARAARGLRDVHAVALQELDRWAPDRRFEVITAFHVLEHVEDPRAFLAQAARRLLPGGLLAVSVPNPDRWALGWIREAWDYPPHHLTRWTVSALRRLLEQQGLAVEEIRSEPLQRWAQLRSASRDICWSLAVGPLSLGIGSRLVSMHPKDEATRPSAAAAAGSGRARVGRALAWLKGGLVETAAVVFALVMFLPMRLARWQGKSLLVLASLGPDVHAGGGMH